MIRCAPVGLCLNNLSACLPVCAVFIAAACRLSITRASADGGQDTDGSSMFEGFTAEHVEGLGHSSSKSKTIVSCLHKLNRATLQRAAGGGNCYRLVGSA